MSENEIIKLTEKTFEDIKHIDKDGNEFWYARELMLTLGYKDWRYFDAVIEKAKTACKNSGMLDTDHFVVNNKMVEAGVAIKSIKDYILNRYACYLIAQNANPRLKAVALAQTYFAVKTRQQEITEEEYKQLSEDEKRIYNRNLAKERNSSLFDIAQKSGVENFGKFNNAGYLGLYEETAKEIKSRKGLGRGQDILDYMGSEELGANIFRITQTEAKLKKANIDNEDLACATHNYVGKAVRRTIKELGGTMPEDLPTPKKSIKELEKEKKKRLKLKENNRKKLK
ncbi:MAG: DNA damage-inducible protein D [Clostridia bacterium]|jgi:DNA-damage-inducible protein D|nr:MAG TPA: DNA-damage-inducible protein D [Caudoviricetes sp.]